MGNYTRKVTRSYEFDGDTISVDMKPLKRAAALKMAPYMETDAEKAAAMSFVEQSEFIDAAASVLPDHITRFEGMTIEGRPVTRESDDFELVMSDMYFVELIGSLVSDLFSASTITADTEKKSEGPSGGISKGQSTGATW